MATLRADGRWVARKRVNGQRISGYGTTSEEANESLRLQISEFLTPQLIDCSKPKTLHECAVAFWQPRIHQTSVRTQKRYSACYALHIYPYFGSKCVLEIKSSDVQNWVNILSEKLVSRSGRGKVSTKMAPKTVLFTLGVLRQILILCVEEGTIQRSPASRINTPKQRPKRQRLMEVEEARELISGTVGTDLHAPVLLASILGLRRSEILDLKWEHLDRQKGTLHVAATGGKTVGSTRTLFLSDSLISEIDKAGDLTCEFICSRHGKVLTKPTLNRLWISYEKRPQDWTFHDLRHGAAGLLYSMTKDVEAVQSILGHSNIDMTMLYIGRSDKGKSDAMNALSRALFE